MKERKKESNVEKRKKREKKEKIMEGRLKE